MKLAYISTMNGMPWGGSEALWYGSAKLALSTGHKVMTITNAWPQVAGPIKNLVGLGAISELHPGYNPDIKVRLYRKVKDKLIKQPTEIKKLKAFAPDRIIVNQGGGYDLLHRPEIRDFLLLTDTPYYILIHNYNDELVLSENQQEILIKIFAKARQVFMICRVQAEAIQKQLARRLNNISIAANPINLEETGVLPMPAGNTVQFASVATFHVERKGQDILLEVLGKAQWKNRNWHLNLYGTGPHERYLKQLAVYFGIADKVTFKGHISDINALWRNNHILLLTSRIETGPMVLMEAMLCGRLAVATRVGKVHELIHDSHNGYVADAPNVWLYEEAMERAWAQRTEWSAIGARAYQAAIEDTDPHAALTFLKMITT